MNFVFENIANARDLGGIVCADGKRVKSGVLLRSANLSLATENDVKRLQKMNLRLVCDLRMEKERIGALDVDIPGAKNVAFDVLKFVSAMPSNMENPEAKSFFRALTPKLYNEFVAEKLCDFVQTGVMDAPVSKLYVGLAAKRESQQEYARMLDCILETQGGTILWHCSQGKDRAGMASVYLLSILGASREDILADYCHSGDSYASMMALTETVAARKHLDATKLGVLKAMVSVNENLLIQAFDFIDAQFGSMEAYLEKALGMTPEKVSLFRKYYLE